MKRKVFCSLLLPIALLTSLAFRPGEARAAVAYTDRAAFFAAVAGLGSSSTLDFESETAGTTLSDPTTISEITFSGYEAGMPDLMIDNTFEATSGVNYLGVDRAGTFNQFSYADGFDLNFTPKRAIGLNIITAEVPGVTLFDDDIRIDVPGIGIARLDADDVDSTTPAGDLVFFIGIIDPSNDFTTARLEGSGAFGFFNIDDITTAVPELGVGAALLAFSPIVIAACWWRRSVSRKPSQVRGALR
jgi:hypothetical protein